MHAHARICTYTHINAQSERERERLADRHTDRDREPERDQETEMCPVTLRLPRGPAAWGKNSRARGGAGHAISPRGERGVERPPRSPFRLEYGRDIAVHYVFDSA